MRYTSVLSRFLISISFATQMLIAILCVLVTLLAFILIPLLHSFTLIFAVPVVVVSWMFRRCGLWVCVVSLTIVLWFYYSLSFHSFFLSLSMVLNFVFNVILLLGLGFMISYQRDALELAESARKKLEIVTVQQQKLYEMKDQFLQNVNHELRTPLTAIYGYLELLFEHNDRLDTRLRETFLQHAMQSCDELQLLVNNVLDSMGMEKAKYEVVVEEVAVRDVVLDVLQRFDPKSIQYHRILVHVPDYIVVRANAQFLRQVIRNLLSNAFKYVPRNTTITISAALHGFVVDPYHASPQIVICVKDEGLGIPPGDLPLLFEQFVRLRRDTTGSIRGSGLGLFLSKQFVEAMGGRIWVESTGVPGEGCAFFFTLPAVVHPKVISRTTDEDFLSFGTPKSLNTH